MKIHDVAVDKPLSEFMIGTCNDNQTLSPSGNPSNRVTSPLPASLHSGRGFFQIGATMKKRGHNFLDLTGQRFGRLTATKDCGRNGRGLVLWTCVCDCKAITIVNSHDLRTGNTKSCGCLAAEGHSIHGMSYTSEYGAWTGMRKRCNCKTDKRYPLYGGRGISICAHWSKFENFLADMGPKPGSAYTLDRINTNGNYEPSNCRWASWKTQQNNRRNNRIIEHNGEKLTASQWADKTGIRSLTLIQRIDRDKWSVGKALTTPLRVWR